MIDIFENSNYATAMTTYVKRSPPCGKKETKTMDEINPRRMKKYFDVAAPVVAFRLSNGQGVETYRKICPPLEKILSKELTPSREKRAEGIDKFKVLQAWMREDEGSVPNASVTEFTPWADTPGEDDHDAEVRFSCLTQRENRIVYLKVRCTWPFKQVAADLGLTEDNARQIFHRAKKKLAAQK